MTGGDPRAGRLGYAGEGGLLTFLELLWLILGELGVPSTRLPVWMCSGPAVKHEP